MPQNPQLFCSKFHINDPKKTAEEHIRIFKTTLKDKGINHEDVACKLFPYSLWDEAFCWYNNLLALSITTWLQLETTFLQEFHIPISANELLLQFIGIKRETNEPIVAFNNIFHRAYARLQTPYVVDDASAREVYYEALDSLTSTFIKWKANPPGSLFEAYDVAVKVSADLRQHLSRPLANQTPMMSSIPQSPLVSHLGHPLSQAAFMPNYHPNMNQPAFCHQ